LIALFHQVHQTETYVEREGFQLQQTLDVFLGFSVSGCQNRRFCVSFPTQTRGCKAHAAA
jgi:hypothetical protein